MLEREARIKIAAKNTDSTDVIDFFAIGRITVDKLMTTVEYEEDERTKEFKTKICIGGGAVVVNKIGEITHSMVFEKGGLNRSVIDTEFGKLEVDVSTEDVLIRESEGSLDIKLLYSILMEENVLSHNEFILSVKYE